jgi:hypothetical protein
MSDRPLLKTLDHTMHDLTTRKGFLGVVIATVLAGGLSAQAILIADGFGNGADGTFSPTTDVTINTDTKACLQFMSLSIPAGVTVFAIGKKPLYIKVLGPCSIAGKIVSNGGIAIGSSNNRPGGAGGTGGAGAGVGGTGGASMTARFNGTGSDGSGARPGIGGKSSGLIPGYFTDPNGGGGGGGNATAGAKGGLPNGPNKVPDVSGLGGKAGVCRAGAGGGGGAGDIDSATNPSVNDGGGGGGGGGGWLTIAAPSMTISGSITCDGGAGGVSAGNGGGGGGGAGGCIDLVCQSTTLTGSLSAVGGAAGAATQSNAGCSPGGGGGVGCINVYGAITGSGTSTPTAKTHASILVVNASCPLPVYVKTTTPTDKFMTGIGVIPLTPPWSSPWGLVCTVDDLFMITLFANTIPGFKNSNGTGSGTLELSVPSVSLPSVDAEILMQSLTVNTSNKITGISSCLKVLMKL